MSLRKVGLDTFHRYECKLNDFMIASGMSIICFLAYRAITKKPLQFFVANRKRFNDHDETAGSVKAKASSHLCTSGALGPISDVLTTICNLH